MTHVAEHKHGSMAIPEAIIALEQSSADMDDMAATLSSRHSDWEPGKPPHDVNWTCGEAYLAYNDLRYHAQRMFSLAVAKRRALGLRWRRIGSGTGGRMNSDQDITRTCASCGNFEDPATFAPGGKCDICLNAIERGRGIYTNWAPTHRNALMLHPMDDMGRECAA